MKTTDALGYRPAGSRPGEFELGLIVVPGVFADPVEPDAGVCADLDGRGFGGADSLLDGLHEILRVVDEHVCCFLVFFRAYETVMKKQSGQAPRPTCFFLKAVDSCSMPRYSRTEENASTQFNQDMMQIPDKKKNQHNSIVHEMERISRRSQIFQIPIPTSAPIMLLEVFF